MDQGYDAPQMPQAPQVQPKKQKTALVIVATAILALAIGAGIVYFIMNNQKADTDLSLSRAESKVKKLEAIIPAGLDIDKLDAGANPGPDDQVGESRVLHVQLLTNEETLNALTITVLREAGDVDLLVPQTLAIDGDWAKTTYIPVVKEAQGGYSVPAIGSEYLIWRKTDGEWKNVGRCSNGPCSVDGVDMKIVPVSVIPLNER